MIGRRVKAPWDGDGEVVKWEPLGAAMCDALVRFDSGREVWHGSHSLRPIDGLGELPSRRTAQEVARHRSIASLQVILSNHIRDFNKPWLGCEHGKAIIGNAIVGAIRELEEE
jgi:hypothetical protein